MKCELYHDNFQNFKRYNVPKAQLVIADIPYNIGADAYASNPMWYQGGDNKNGESKLAKQSFFHTDGTFKIAEYMHFCNRLLKKEPKEKGQAPAMIVFCAFEQMQTVIEYGKRYGFAKSYPLFFCKNYSAQVLKANMKIVGATEFAVVLYRDKLPKFRNVGEDGRKHMVFDWFRWEREQPKGVPEDTSHAKAGGRVETPDRSVHRPRRRGDRPGGRERHHITRRLRAGAQRLRVRGGQEFLRGGERKDARTDLDGDNDNLTTGGGRAVRAARPCRLKRDLFPAVPERIFVAAEGPQWAGIPAVS